MSFILKWIYLQSAFIKPPSIKEQHPLILITEDGAWGERGVRSGAEGPPTAARTQHSSEGTRGGRYWDTEETLDRRGEGRQRRTQGTSMEDS